MTVAIAGDLLASEAGALIPGWIGWVTVCLSGFVAGWLAGRIAEVRRLRAWHRWAVGGLAGIVVGAIVLFVAYYFFHVELS